jgi:type IV pilus assembly protein PilV
MQKNPAVQTGFTLLEVLIATLVLSLGILGIGALQIKAMQQNSRTLIRTQATILVGDMADRMRANVVGLTADATLYNKDNFADAELADDDPFTIQSADPSDPLIATDCFTNNCTAAQLAAWDLEKWQNALRNSNTFPNGAIGCVTCNSADVASDCYTPDVPVNPCRVVAPLLGLVA